MICFFFFFFKQKTAYEMRISDWSSDVCSSDLYLERLRDGGQDSVVYRCRHRRADGGSYPVEVRLSFSRDEVPPVFMAIATDISDRLAGEAKLEPMANYDGLTRMEKRSGGQECGRRGSFRWECEHQKRKLTRNVGQART